MIKHTLHSSGRIGEYPHIVIIGGGFAGLNVVKHIDLRYYRITVVDANNFHSFSPLFYQVASAGLDPASICFPLRRELRKLRSPNVAFNMGLVSRIDLDSRKVYTDMEVVGYDILIIAAGTTNNFFGNTELAENVYTIKSTSESLRCRNDILRRLEMAAIEPDKEKRRSMLHFVVVGGGPTGVEIAGAIGEMKRYVLPREYPTIAQDDMSITVLEGSGRLLGTMSEFSSRRALSDLGSLMVDVRLNTRLQSYDRDVGMVTFVSGETIEASMLIWTAGVTGVHFNFAVAEDGVVATPEFIGRGNRIITDSYCRVKGYENVYAIGDIALMDGDTQWPNGHPQLAQVAIQQGRLVACNLNLIAKEHDHVKFKAFCYKDKGTMATIGRNRAVVDIGKMHMSGFIAWLAWMWVHLLSLLGMRNKLTVLINWIWAYFNYSTSLRLIICPNRFPLKNPLKT